MIGSGGPEPEQAASLARDDAAYVRFLMDWQRQERKAGEFNAKNDRLHWAALSLMRNVNDLHGSPDAVRFASLQSFNAAELYTIMVNSEQEINTSSFNKLFDRLMGLVQAEGMTREDFMENRVHRLLFRSFIRLLARYNRLNDYLKPMTLEHQRSFLSAFVERVDEDTDELSQAVAVADTFSMIHDRQILNVLKDAVHREYDRMDQSHNARGKIIYSLLVSLFGNNPVVDDAWVKEMAVRYKIPTMLGIETATLFNHENINAQRYSFFESGDGDGINSFNNFLAQYRDSPDWTIQDHGSFVIVEGQQAGKHIVIYANRPNQKDGRSDREKAIAAAKLVPTVYVGRGHSTFASEMVQEITPETLLVWLGPCGGDKGNCRSSRQSSKRTVLLDKRYRNHAH